MLLDEGLAFGARFPTGLRAFVTPYVDIFRREDFDDFIENVIDEIVGFWVSGTEHVVTHAPNAPYSIRASSATQFGVGRECTEHVAGRSISGMMVMWRSAA